LATEGSCFSDKRRSPCRPAPQPACPASTHTSDKDENEPPPPTHTHTLSADRLMGGRYNQGKGARSQGNKNADNITGANAGNQGSDAKPEGCHRRAVAVGLALRDRSR